MLWHVVASVWCDMNYGLRQLTGQKQHSYMLESKQVVIILNTSLIGLNNEMVKTRNQVNYFFQNDNNYRSLSLSVCYC